jgi:diguanylate cyclase (GGDEF)-like protein
LRPVPSVKSRVLAGFGLTLLILVASLVGSALMVRDYQSAVADMEADSRVASLIQDTRSDAGNAALLLQRYVIVGDETLVPEIRVNTAAAVEEITQAAQAETDSEDASEAIVLTQLALSAPPLAGSVDDIIALKQAGLQAAAEAAVEQIVPRFRQFRLILGDIANSEIAQLSETADEAGRAGDRALGLIVVSGISGVVVAIIGAYFVSRSIVSPLTALETTARRIGEGDLDARTTGRGAREFRNLSGTLNDMAARLKQRETDLVHFNMELRERNRQLLEARAQAATDGLTALGNHRTFQEILRSLVPNPESAPVSLVMIDIDGFKLVNDVLGHQVGDDILRGCARIFSEAASGHAVYRYGGDEFAVVIMGIELDGAEELAEHLRTSVLSDPDIASRQVTISLGVASYPETAGSAEELIYEADAAMYGAKLSGKNLTYRWDRISSSPLTTPRRRPPPVPQPN